MPQPVIGIVLAGGKSKRMKTDKSLLEVTGKPLILRVGEALLSQLPRIVVVTEAPDRYHRFFNDTVSYVPDLYPDAGPLAGIRAGLGSLSLDEIGAVVVGCDMPFLSPELIAHLAKCLQSTAHAPLRQPRNQSPPGRESSGSSVKAIVPRDHTGRAQFLCAAYHRSCLSSIDQCLHQRGESSVASFVNSVTTVYLTSEETAIFAQLEHAFFNVNTPQDLALARRWAPGTSRGGGRPSDTPLSDNPTL